MHLPEQRQPGGHDTGADSVVGQGDENPTGRLEPAIALEWVGPAVAKLGQPVTCQMVVRNTSAVAVTNLIIRNRIPTGVTVQVTRPQAVTEGNQLTWEIGTLQARQEKRLELVLLPQTKGDLSCQAQVTLTSSSIARIYVREPKLTLKATGPDKILLGEVAALTLTVTNPGDGSAEHVRLKAMLPDGLEHARGKTVEFDLGNLEANETRSVQLVCATKGGGAQVCQAVATAEGDLRADASASVEVIVPRLDFTASGPRLRYVNRHASYVFKVTNPGNAAANNVVVSEHVPAGFKFVNASDGGHHDFSTRVVSWYIGDLLPNQSRELTLELIAVNTGDYKHKVSVVAARGLRCDVELGTRIDGLAALLMELVDLDDPVEVGADTAYEIRVVNTGSKTETNLQLTCIIPDKMEFRGAKGAGGCKFTLNGKELVFEPLPRLAPRADALYRVNVRGTAPGDLRFRARIMADGLSEPVIKEESTKVYGD
jgi:uncharacterized repeat protein (TIGR01451 family)